MPRYSNSEFLKKLDYHHVPTAELSDAQATGLKRLLARSTHHDHPRLSWVLASTFAHRTIEQARNLNAHVGSSTLRPYQRYARTMIAFAVDTDTDQAVGMQIAADNASAHAHYPVPWPLRSIIRRWPAPVEAAVRPLEMRAKLHLLPAHIARWHWLGARAVEPNWLPNASPFPSNRDLTLPDVLGFLTLGSKQHDQPVSAYPYDTELWWKNTLTEWSMSPTDEESRRVPAFGRVIEADPVRMTHWIGNVGSVHAAIDSKLDPAGLIKHAIVSSNSR